MAPTDASRMDAQLVTKQDLLLFCRKYGYKYGYEYIAFKYRRMSYPIRLVLALLGMVVALSGAWISLVLCMESVGGNR